MTESQGACGLCYRAALGMYELELAYMIVAHSQRDPGEYLLELQQFAAKPNGPLRHYAINMHLARTSAALKNLLEAGDQHFEAALQLARREVRACILQAASIEFVKACHLSKSADLCSSQEFKGKVLGIPLSQGMHRCKMQPFQVNDQFGICPSDRLQRYSFYARLLGVLDPFSVRICMSHTRDWV